MSEVLDKPKAKSKALACQPLEIVNVDGARLVLPTVEALVGKKATWIYLEIKAGRFPARVGYYWRAEDIRKYLRGEWEPTK